MELSCISTKIHVLLFSYINGNEDKDQKSREARENFIRKHLGFKTPYQQLLKIRCCLILTTNSGTLLEKVG